MSADIQQFAISSDNALARLKEGNKKYVSAKRSYCNVSSDVRVKLCREGQSPYAVIVACSDSRVIPEYIFSAGLGELFVIRTAGNVIDNDQLGSIQYAVEHLGCTLVVVLGHDHCGAVTAAIEDNPEGYIKYTTDKIKAAVGEELDKEKAARLNALNGVRVIKESLSPQGGGLTVSAALYHTETGKVDFF